MSVLALPVLAAIAGALLVLGAIAALIGPRFAAWGSMALCGLGAVTVLVFLLAGAEPAAMLVPFGLASQSSVLALDGIAGIFLLLLMLAGVAASSGMLDDHGHPPPTHPAFPVFLGGMALTLLAADAFALVAGFELTSIASFALVVTYHRDAQVRAAGLLYVGMAALSALCLIAALALLARDGSSFAAIRAHPPEGWRGTVMLLLTLIGAGSKAGLFPLHVWLPPAHAAAPGPVSALMSGAMTKVAMYVLVRLLFDLAGPGQPLWWALPLLAMGVASAVIGALRANLETDVKAILACSTIENIGLIAIGLGLAMAARAADLPALAGLALGASFLHVLGHGMFKSVLFLGAGAIQHGAGSRQLSRLGGLIRRMPITSCCMLIGAACLAGLPPTAGFASEWLLYQSLLGAVRLGGLGLQILVCVLAAAMVLATALAAAAALRLIGVALLGRPRSQPAAAAAECGPPTRWALLFATAIAALIGIFPGAFLTLAEPAVRLLATATLVGRATALRVSASNELPGYMPFGVILLLGCSAVAIAVVLRARAVLGHRTGPAWDCGFGAPPAWLPFGDPLTQYGSGLSAPLRRVLGTTLLSARQQIDLPAAGDTSAAIFAQQANDPADAYLFAPIAALRHRLSRLADWMHFLTVRQTLTVMVTLLVLLLSFIALVEQL